MGFYYEEQQRLWFKEPGEHLEDVKETPVEIAVPLVVMVVLLLVVGVAPFVFSDLANNAAIALLGI